VLFPSLSPKGGGFSPWRDSPGEGEFTPRELHRAPLQRATVLPLAGSARHRAGPANRGESTQSSLRSGWSEHDWRFRRTVLWRFDDPLRLLRTRMGGVSRPSDPACAPPFCPRLAPFLFPRARRFVRRARKPGGQLAVLASCEWTRSSPGSGWSEHDWRFRRTVLWRFDDPLRLLRTRMGRVSCPSDPACAPPLYPRLAPFLFPRARRFVRWAREPLRVDSVLAWVGFSRAAAITGPAERVSRYERLHWWCRST